MTLVGLAAGLLSGEAGAQEKSFDYDWKGEYSSYTMNEAQVSNCGCSTKQSWNVPEGAAVVGRSTGPFMAIMEVMGEYGTHILINRGKMAESDVPWVVHTSTYEQALSRAWEIEAIPGWNVVEKLSKAIDVANAPIYPGKLAYNGPGTSRTSVAGTYEYFHKLGYTPIYLDNLDYLYTEMPSYATNPFFQSFVQQEQAKRDADPWGYSGPIGYLKQRFAPESIRWVPGVWTEANICEGEEGFQISGTNILRHARCRPSFGQDGSSTESCADELDPEQKITCVDSDAPLESAIRLRERLVDAAGRPISPMVREPSRWPGANRKEETRTLDELSRVGPAAGGVDPAGITEETGGSSEKIRVCKWPAEERTRLCYSRRINLGQEAVRRTDGYPVATTQFTTGTGASMLGDYSQVLSYAKTSFLHPFHFSRSPVDGAWGYNAPTAGVEGGFAAPYYLKQYVDIERANEGFATPGLACSTFASFLQAQSMMLAYVDYSQNSKPFLWDQNYKYVSTKKYPAERVRAAAHAIHDVVSSAIRGNGPGGADVPSVLSLGLINALGAYGQAIKDVAAEHAANQIVNCIMFGPTNGQCGDTSPTWNEFLRTAEGQEFSASSISADWMIGRSGFDEEGNVIGAMNPRESIWSRSLLAAFGGADAEYSSEGRVCTCW